MWHDGGWGGWLAMALLMVAFWAGVIVLVIWLVRGGTFQQARRGSTKRPSALDILDGGSSVARSTGRSTRAGEQPYWG